MKTLPILLAATTMISSGAAFAQEINIDTPMMGDPTKRSSHSLSKVMNLYLDPPLDVSMPVLNLAIVTELDRSNNVDLVHSPIEAAQLVAPTKVTLPKEGKSEMKVAFQFTFWRASEQDFTVSCAVGKPEDCAKAIRTWVDRLIRGEER